MLSSLADILMFAMLPLLLLASGFFSGSETALFSLSEHQRLQLARSGGLAGQTVSQLLAETRTLLITLLLGNMVINVIYFVSTTVLMVRLQEAGRIGALGVSALSVTFLLMLICLGEVIPKLVATRKPMVWSRIAALPLMALHRVAGPLRTVLNALVITPLARLIAPREKPADLSPQELEMLLDLSEKRGVIDPVEEDTLQQVLALSQIKVGDLMIPRVDIKAHDLNDPPAELMKLINDTRLSKIPVYRGDLDHIEGVVYARQALLIDEMDDTARRKLLRRAMFVPEIQRADQLLLQFRKTGTTLAIAVDEYGGTAGVVALEDIVEHMLGEITGPFEHRSTPNVASVSPGVWRVSAGLAINDWAEAFGQPHHDATVTTIGGLVMARLGRVPAVGDHVELGNIRIEVERMNGRRVDSLLLRLQDGAKELNNA